MMKKTLILLLLAFTTPVAFADGDPELNILWQQNNRVMPHVHTIKRILGGDERNYLIYKDDKAEEQYLLKGIYDTSTEPGVTYCMYKAKYKASNFNNVQEIISELSLYPNISKLLENGMSWRYKNTNILLEPYFADEMTLERYLELNKGNLPESTANQLKKNIYESLVEMHKITGACDETNHIAYYQGDLSSDNLLINLETLNVRLIDFGMIQGYFPEDEYSGIVRVIDQSTRN